ncbi:(S)-benzoin forming benzil reductase [Echinicola sediminis]
MGDLYVLTGCSKGLGKAIMEELLRDEANFVVGISRTPMKSSGNFTHVVTDLENPSDLVSKLPEIFPNGKYKKVVLINNAGWIGDIAPLGRLSPEGIAKIQLVNVVAPGILMNEYVRRFGELEVEKMVVNISSGAANKDMDGWSGYSSSKAALNRMTGVAQRESDQNGYGIKYFALSPGIVDTPMQEDIRAANPQDFSSLKNFISFKENDELEAPSSVAKKVTYLIDHVEDFEEVLQDVRKF